MHTSGAGLSKEFDKMNLIEGGGSGLQSSGMHQHAMGMPATTTTIHEERFIERRGSDYSSSEGEYDEDLDANGMPVKKKRGLG